MKTKLSESQEDYLKHIFLLSEKSDENVSANALAERLKVKPASVTNMLKKLSELSLIEYVPYKGASLTSSGELIALEVLRHHRLLELYLSEMMGYSWDEVHEEAEKLEHVISERFEAKMAEQLGHPTHDPHGDPIPDQNLKLPSGPAIYPITSLKAGVTGAITRVLTQDKDTLNMLTRLSLVMNAELEIIAQERNGVRIRVGDERFLIPLELASNICISKNEFEKTK
ncbi:MAG: metal-dependent transcriptional regulator [Balneolales bacterium]|nr:metal-dependent transcriptional regulator [Balneolales bacterium]